MVYVSRQLASLITAALLSQTVLAHPGHHEANEIAARDAYYKNNKRDLSHCTDTLKKRGIEEKQAKRRQNEVNKLRKERGITKPKERRTVHYRDASVLDESHLSTLDVTSTTTSSGYWGVEDIIFSNASCILMPEGEVGPFWVDGEFIRRDVREDQDGFDVVIDAQFIDVTTCDPVPGIMWDIWSANSTGVYGGVIGSGNGNEDDTGNLNNTFLRGLQMTDGDGVAQFLTIFPGHYAGRATHTHVIAHVGGTVLSNGTYSGGTIPYIGQLFYDQDLITEVNKLEPYSLDTIAIELNADDRVVATEIIDNGDPFVNYVLLGDSVADGMFMWIDIGIDPTASYDATAASDWTAKGGVEVSSASTTTGSGSNSTMGGGNSTSGGFSNSTGGRFGTSGASSATASSATGVSTLTSDDGTDDDATTDTDTTDNDSSDATTSAASTSASTTAATSDSTGDDSATDVDGSDSSTIAATSKSTDDDSTTDDDSSDASSTTADDVTSTDSSATYTTTLYVTVTAVSTSIVSSCNN